MDTVTILLILFSIAATLLSNRKANKQFLFIIKQLSNMSDKLTDIKADLIAANEKADKVAADVALLHAKIDELDDDDVTPEEIAEIKSLSTALNNKLQGIDDSTPEEETPTP